MVNWLWDFFHGKPLLMSINPTHKSHHSCSKKKLSAIELGDFGPISWANLIYKLLSMVLVGRLMEVTGLLVSPNQTTFMPGRTISDNSLLGDETLHNFRRTSTPKRCCLRP